MSTRNFSEIVEQFLEYKLANEGRSAGTVRKYRGVLMRLQDYCRQVAKCDPLEPGQDVLAAYTGPHLHKQGLVARSRRPIVAAIRGFYLYCYHRNICRENHAAKVVSPKVGRKLPVPMSLEAAERLMWAPDLDHFTGLRDAAMLSLLIGCGMRVTGLVDLNESDLRFEQYQGREVLTVRIQEKGEKQRLVPAPDEARLLVRAYLGHPEHRTIDRELPDGDRVLFVSVRNRTVPLHEYRGEKRRISDWSVRDMIVKYSEKVGITRDMAHPHAIRHLYGTELAEGDVPEAVRQMLMGHEDANSTKIYTHLAQRKAREAVAKGNPLSKIRTPVSDLLRSL